MRWSTFHFEIASVRNSPFQTTPCLVGCRWRLNCFIESRIWQRKLAGWRWWPCQLEAWVFDTVDVAWWMLRPCVFFMWQHHTICTANKFKTSTIKQRKKIKTFYVFLLLRLLETSFRSIFSPSNWNLEMNLWSSDSARLTLLLMWIWLNLNDWLILYRI